MITGPSDKGNGSKYKTGLNITSGPFPLNAMHLTNEKNIARYFSQGVYLRIVEVPTTSEYPPFKIHKDRHYASVNALILKKRMRLSDLSTFEYLESVGCDFNVYRNAALIWAVDGSHDEIIDFLIKTYFETTVELDEDSSRHFINNPSTFGPGGYHFVIACSRGLLGAAISVNKTNPSMFSDAAALLAASKKGHLEIVKIFIQNGLDMHKTHVEIAISEAQLNGYFEVGEALEEALRAKDSGTIGSHLKGLLGITSY